MCVWLLLVELSTAGVLSRACLIKQHAFHLFQQMP